MSTDSRRVKLLLSYDIRPSLQDTYFQFMLGEVVPTLQSLGLEMNNAWHTAYGNYPMRLVEFNAPNYEAAEAVLTSRDWARLERKLKDFVFNYTYKIVPLREDQFQF